MKWVFDNVCMIAATGFLIFAAIDFAIGENPFESIVLSMLFFIADGVERNRNG